MLMGAATAVFVPAIPAILRAKDTPGVSATEIRIGNTMPYGGPASVYGTIGKADAATFRMANEMVGFAGRRVNFISYDDHYSPATTVAQVRRLVEQDQVACLFNTLGTSTNLAIVNYCNTHKLPQLFVSTGADKWGDYKEHPWTIGWQPSYRVEAQIYAKYILKIKPDAKIGILYQNDIFGQDYLKGVRDVIQQRFDKMVTTAPYEVTDATINSPLLRLQSAGIDVLLTAATPKFAIQTIRKAAEINWKPMHVLSGVSASVVHPLNQCDIWRCCNTEATLDAMPPSAAPHKGMLVGVPVIGGTPHGLLDLGPCLKAPSLQREGTQHLPPRLQQVQIGGIDRLEHELPTRVGQREQQHVGGGVGVEIVHHRVNPFNSRVDPPLDLAEEVNPICNGAAGVSGGERSAAGGLQGAKHVAGYVATAIIDFLFGPFRPRPGWLDEASAGIALGGLWSHFVKTDDNTVVGWGGVEALNSPLLRSKSGSTRAPNQVSS